MRHIQLSAVALVILLAINSCGQKETAYLNPDASVFWLAVEDGQNIFWQQSASKNRSFQLVSTETTNSFLSDDEVYQASRLEVVRRYKSKETLGFSELPNQSPDQKYSAKENRKMWDALIARTYYSIIQKKDKRALKKWIAFNVQPDSAFLAAAQTNNLEAMSRLLKAFPDVSLKASLYEAVVAGYLKMLILLVKNGADIEQEYVGKNGSLSLLDLALDNKQETVATWLLDNLDFSNTFIMHSSALHSAVRFGNLTLVKELIQKGMALNQLDHQKVTPLMLADIYNHEKIKTDLIEFGAVRYTKKQLEQITLQLERDQQFSTWQRPSPLISALAQHNLGYAYFCLENVEWNKGFQPLLVAIEKQWEEAIILLIQKGVELNQVDDQKQTALIKAAQSGSVNLVTLLLKNGAVVNQRDNRNLNALFYAAKAGHWQVVESLIANGADGNCHDFDGRHVLFYAEQAGKLAIVERLLKQQQVIRNRKQVAQLRLNTAILSGEIKLVENQVRQIQKNKALLDPLYYLVRQCICNKKLTLLKKYLKDDMNLQYEYDDGQTMLHLAVQSNYPEMVAWLLSKGADKTVKNRNGFSAEDCAQQEFLRTGINVFDILLSRTQKLNFL